MHMLSNWGLVKDSGSGSLSQESDKGLGTHSDVEESGDSDEEGSAADLDPDSSQSSLTALSESSLQSAGHGTRKPRRIRAFIGV